MSTSVVVLRQNQKIVSEVKVADTFFNRLFGLLPVKVLKESSGILLKPCKQVHTFMMKYAIDAIFLSEENIILHIEYNLIPNKVTKYIKETKSILETTSGVSEKYMLKVGDMLRMEKIDEVN